MFLSLTFTVAHYATTPTTIIVPHLRVPGSLDRGSRASSAEHRRRACNLDYSCSLHPRPTLAHFNTHYRGTRASWLRAHIFIHHSHLVVLQRNAMDGFLRRNTSIHNIEHCECTQGTGRHCQNMVADRSICVGWRRVCYWLVDSIRMSRREETYYLCCTVETGAESHFCSELEVRHASISPSAISNAKSQYWSYQMMNLYNYM